MIPFLILSMPRSGTQMLSGLLGQHPAILVHGEVLNRTDENLSTTDLIWQCWLQPQHQLFAAVGATIMHDQLCPRPFMLQRLLAIPGMRVLVLERKNQMERIRSMFQAEKRWNWNVDQPADYLPAVELRPDRVLNELRSADLWHQDLGNIRNPVMWLYQEDLDHTNMTPIWKFLGVNDPGPLTQNTFRQESRPYTETITNSEEIWAALRETRYAHYVP